MAASKKLIAWHSENCPAIDIDSVEFSFKLIEEISKLKTKIGEPEG